MSSQPEAPPTSPLSLSERLQTVTEALATARTQNDVFGVVLTPAREALEAVAGAVLLVDEAGIRLNLAATQGDEEGAQTLWQDGPLDGNVPAGDALKRHEPLFFEHEGDLVRAYPELEARTGGVAAVATAVLPMFLDERPLGTLILDFQEPHTFTPEEQRFLRTLAAQCALALGRVRLNTRLQHELHTRTQMLDWNARAYEAFVAFSEAAGQDTDLLSLARQAITALRAQFPDGSVVYYEPEGELWTLRAWSEDLGEDFIALLTAGVPSSTSFIASTLQARQPVFTTALDPEQQQVDRNEVYGTAAHTPIIVGGEVRAILGLGIRESRQWQARDQAVFRAVGRTLTLALERAQAQRDAEERTRRIEEDARAQEAFAAFTEAASTETDVITLAGQAVNVIQARFTEGIGGYYEREGDLWKLRTWTSNLNTQPDFIAALQAGLPSDTPFIVNLLRERALIFTESWDAEHEGIEDSGDYGTVAAYPVIVGGEVRGFFTMGFKSTSRWVERDRAIVRAVGHSLTLAVERAEQTRRLAEQNVELSARTRTLEAFAELSRDLTLHGEPGALIRRAQEIVRSLLPPGFAVYYELEHGLWRVRSQVDSHGSPELQAAVDAGLPRETPSLLTPFDTGQPLYQDAYPQGADTPAKMVRHVQAVATLPLVVNGAAVGVFGVGLFEGRVWSAADRAVLETVVRSLGLALERAQGVRQLAQRTEELERSNKELEQFAYIASHDLQAPIRAVTSFAGVIDRKYGPQLDERGRLYLRQIKKSGEHMKRLVDDLLAFSRVHTEQRPLRFTDAGAVLGTVLGRLQPEIEALGASVTHGELPRVVADAQQLDQLLQNLIANGLKYRREGVAPQVHVSAEREGRVWRFAVSDNGIGIEPQYFERIFVIFQRLHGREEYEGTGIGLAVCKKIVERHGGRLWLESTLGQGSTFFFTLPGA
ncbi:hypothetical protein DAETH_48680 (plasmid) [Deinococcus aetherius]|uniref:histidine kinase n=1 Tax=Deinococcus aetherius TaxID=200252 RepID=A0ABM8AM20_9DEIO|nr:GAF domain-containing protein [Deinococcus aetherius]BDP44899.1 hypothetical protein DAETH_48680 [Deinococcus aetherius]